MKKMISILLALSTAIVMCMPLCAEEPESGGIRNVFSDNDISCIQNLLLAWLSTDGPSENIDSVQVGDKIPAYEYVDSSLVTFDSASYYPVYSDHELSLIHISEPTRQAEISYAVFCLKKKTINAR